MSISSINAPEPEPTVPEPEKVEAPLEAASTEANSVSASASTPIASTSEAPKETGPTAVATPVTSVSEPAQPTSGACPNCKPNLPCDKHILEAIMARVAPPAQQKKYLKMLIFAQPGAGKTVLAGTAPKNLILDTEDGLTSLNNHPDIVAPDLLTIPYMSFFQAENLVRFLHEDVDQFKDRDVFTIDTASELHKKGLAETVEREWQKNPVLVNRYVAQTEHHTENNEHIRRLISSLRDLNRHVIITCHARTIEPKGKPALTFPDFSEKLANTLSGMMDVVGYLYKKELDGQIVRVLRVHTEGTIACKTRIGGIPAEIINPTWPMLFEYFEKHNASAVG